VSFAASGIAASKGFAFQQEEPEPFRIVSDTELVVVDVGVLERGGYVRGLAKENFTIEENGQRRPVTSFSAGDQPITVGLVIDRSGSMEDKWQEVLAAAGKLVRASHPQDEFFLVTFSDRAFLNIEPGTDTLRDTAKIYQLLEGLRLGGRTALYDGVSIALANLRRGRNERKALVVISDGGDNASFSTRAAVMQLAERSLATVYAVGIFDTSDQDANPKFLSHIAHLTGGEAFFPKELSELNAIAARISTDMRARYTIGFSPADTRLDNSVRQFKVLVQGSQSHRKWKIRARNHYVASSSVLAGAGDTTQ